MVYTVQCNDGQGATCGRLCVRQHPSPASSEPLARLPDSGPGTGMACCPGWSGRWCSQFALISRRSFRLPAGKPRRRRPAPHPHFGYASHIHRNTLTRRGSPDVASHHTTQNQRSSLALPPRASSLNALNGSASPSSAAVGGGARWSWRVLGKYLDLMMCGAREQASLGLQGDRVDHRSRDLSSCRLTYSGPVPCRVRDPRGPAPVHSC
jgi:hypothetical protein